MQRLVSIILNFMIKNNVISKDTEEIEFYRYGIEITLSSLINIALISIIGIVTNYTFESTMFLAVFIIMRSFTGGYHANTYIKCNLVISISFVILLLNKHRINYKRCRPRANNSADFSLSFNIYNIRKIYEKGGFLMKIKVAVAKSVKALVGHMAKAACGSASHWGHINLKNLNLRKKRSNR